MHVFQLITSSVPPESLTYLPHLSNASSFLRSQRVLRAYLSILSDASQLVTWKPSSSNIIESTLKQINQGGL